jgi:uroporphyrin-III C-methyltransferase
MFNTKSHFKNQQPSPGVYLIGAGPGAADLITVRGSNILSKADIVFYDSLIDEEILSWCPQAKLVSVGKRCGKYSNSQLFINQQLINASSKHNIVVRLKGGDPLIFGRATEEIEALRNAKIHFEIVPGITTALAASAALQQAPTSRNISRSLKITTLPTRLNYIDQETKIYYMGRDQLSTIANELMQQGQSGNTPVCLMESVSNKDQKSFGATLEELSFFNSNALLSNEKPLIVMIGEVYRNTFRTLLPLIPEIVPENRELSA